MLSCSVSLLLAVSLCVALFAFAVTETLRLCKTSLRVVRLPVKPQSRLLTDDPGSLHTVSLSSSRSGLHLSSSSTSVLSSAFLLLPFIIIPLLLPTDAPHLFPSRGSVACRFTSGSSYPARFVRRLYSADEQHDHFDSTAIFSTTARPTAQLFTVSLVHPSRSSHRLRLFCVHLLGFISRLTHLPVPLHQAQTHFRRHFTRPTLPLPTRAAPVSISSLTTSASAAPPFSARAILPF